MGETSSTKGHSELKPFTMAGKSEGSTDGRDAVAEEEEGVRLRLPGGSRGLGGRFGQSLMLCPRRLQYRHAVGWTEKVERGGRGVSRGVSQGRQKPNKAKSGKIT